MATVPPLPTWGGCSPNANPISGDSTLRDAASITKASASAAGASLSAVGLLGAAASAGAITMGIGSAAVALYALGTTIANVFSGCGQTCVQASKYADETEPYLAEVLSQYQSSPTHTRALQYSAATLIVGAFQALCNACGQASLGDAGVRCISERLVRGSVWDWPTRYLDPILNDNTVVPDAPPAPSGLQTYSPVTGIPTGSDPQSISITQQISQQTTGAIDGLFSDPNSAVYIVLAVLALAVLKKAGAHK